MEFGHWPETEFTQNDPNAPLARGSKVKICIHAYRLGG